MKVTLSVIKADIGGYVGHSESHPDIIAKAAECLNKAKKDGLLIDCQTTKCGDDLQLIMTHEKGTGNYEIHKLAWDTFVTGTKLAKKMADMMRRHGPFEPHRLPLEEMEYTTMPQVMKKLEGRFQDLDREKD